MGSSMGIIFLPTSSCHFLPPDRWPRKAKRWRQKNGSFEESSFQSNEIDLMVRHIDPLHGPQRSVAEQSNRGGDWHGFLDGDHFFADIFLPFSSVTRGSSTVYLARISL